MSEAALEPAYDVLPPAQPGDRYAAAAAGVLAVIGGRAGRGAEELDVDDPAEVLEDLVERWALTYSPNTVKLYRANLGEWLAYCRQRGEDPLTVGPDVVRDYQAAVDASPLVPVSARVKLAAVRSFYRFVVEDRAIDHDPAAGTTRRPPATLAASLAVAGQDRSLMQLANGFVLTYTRHTRAAYASVLRVWFTWCQEIGVDPLQVQRAHVDAFRAVLDERYKPATVNQRLVVVRSFYRYCVEEGALTKSPARTVKMHRLPNVTSSTGVDREEARALLRAARDHGSVHHALFTLLLLNGLRISEALGTDVEDLVTIRGHRVLMVQRKGTHGSRQAVPLAPRTSALIDAWLEVRPSHIKPGWGTATTGPIFLNNRGTRMSRESAWATIRTLAKRAVPGKAHTLHPHDLRNAYVTLSLDAGVPLRDVQDSAGHSSADTTRRYDTGRNNLDRNATYTLTAYLGGGDE